MASVQEPLLQIAASVEDLVKAQNDAALTQTALRRDVTTLLHTVFELKDRLGATAAHNGPRLFEHPAAASAVLAERIPWESQILEGSKSEHPEASHRGGRSLAIHEGALRSDSIFRRQASDSIGRSRTIEHNGSLGKSSDEDGPPRLLPENWPNVIQKRSILDLSHDTLTKEQVIAMVARGKGKKKGTTTSDRFLNGHAWHSPSARSSDTALGSLSCLRVMHPHHKLVILCDMLALLAMVHDLSVVPYLLAWNPERTDSTYYPALAVAIYWTLNVPLRFRVGFFKRGELLMGDRAVAMHYFKTIFILDAILVAIDWFVLVNEEAQGTRSLTLLRLAKWFKIMKVLRLTRGVSIVEKSLEAVLPQRKVAVVLVEVVVGTLVFSHIMCCAWFSIGCHSITDTGERWVNVFEGRAQYGMDLRNEDMFLYFTSFHWVLAQITLGAMEVSPVNTAERLFCIMLLVLGMLFSATIVSLISSETMSFVTSRRIQIETISTMRRYLNQSKTETHLSVRVLRQVVERLTVSEIPLQEDEVKGIALLSLSLRRELQQAVRAPHLYTHALFRMWASVEQQAFTSLCDEVVQFVSCKPQDTMFLAGQEASATYYMVQGRLFYSQEPESSLELKEQITTVKAECWLCEMVMFTHWIHVGRLESDSTGLLMMLPADILEMVLPRHPVVGFMTRQYGRNYHMRILAARPPYSSWPNDLGVANTAASDLMSQDVGLELLRQAYSNGNLNITSEAFDELIKEVESEKCAIQEASGGVLERIVALVAFRIVRYDRGPACLLAEVGTYDKGKGSIKPACTLPGKKRMRGELPKDTAQRILNADLAQWRDGIDLQGCLEEVEIKESKNFGLMTKYLRTVQSAKLHAAFQAPNVPTAMVPVDSSMPSKEASVASGAMHHASTGTPHTKKFSGSGMPQGLQRRASQASLFSQRSRNIPDDLDIRKEKVIILERDGKHRLYCWMPVDLFTLVQEGERGRDSREGTESPVNVFWDWINSRELLDAVADCIEELAEKDLAIAKEISILAASPFSHTSSASVQASSNYTSEPRASAVVKDMQSRIRRSHSDGSCQELDLEGDSLCAVSENDAYTHI